MLRTESTAAGGALQDEGSRKREKERGGGGGGGWEEGRRTRVRNSRGWELCSLKEGAAPTDSRFFLAREVSQSVRTVLNTSVRPSVHPAGRESLAIRVYDTTLQQRRQQ